MESCMKLWKEISRELTEGISIKITVYSFDLAEKVCLITKMSEITFIKSRKSNILLSLMKSDKKYTFTIQTRTTQIESSNIFHWKTGFNWIIQDY